MIHRKGLGRTRHIDTGLLWDQETAATKRLAFNKVLGTVNPADLLTKYLAREVSVGHCDRLSLSFRTGRADSAPKLNVLLKAIFDYDFDKEDLDQDEHDNNMTTQLQHTINALWHTKWKTRCKTTIYNMSNNATTTTTQPPHADCCT